MLFNAEVYDHVKEGPELGLENTAGVTLNWGAIQKRKQGIVDKHAKGLQFLMRKNKVTVIEGYGKLTGPAKNGVHTVDVESKSGKSQVQAKNLLLSTGSVARMLPGLQADEQILTNIEVLSLNSIPKSLIVIGSGAVGVEFASIYKSFGADVTILEMLPRYVPVEDEEVSKELMRVYRKRGINGFVNAKVEKLEKTKQGVAVTFTVDGKQQTLEAEKVLVAIGRAPRTENVGIEKTKIQLERGFVKVDEYMRTAEPGIYAVGDIVMGYPQLAHSGGMEGIVAVTHIAGKPAKPINTLRIPNATYCHPEIGSVGLTEAKAKELGYNVKVGKFPFTANSRASIVGAARGLREDCRRHEVRRDPGRPHHRADSDRVDCRISGCPGDGVHGGRAGQYHPRPSHIVRGNAGRRQRGVRHGDQRLRTYTSRSGAQTRTFNSREKYVSEGWLVRAMPATDAIVFCSTVQLASCNDQGRWWISPR